MPSFMQQQKSRSGGMSPTKIGEKEELAQARAVKRAERVEARRVHAEKHKETGNVHFRAGDYHKAIEEYDAAVEIHGPSAAYLSNLAAAWLKLEEYDLAEHCALRALDIDPRFKKARYRRGLARRGKLEYARAAADFAAVVEQDPDATEAKDALRETLALMIERNEEDEFELDSDDKFPMLAEAGVELESVSDSSDWHHEGNGIPCRFYNRDGCLRGTDCRFSHAPDHKSVRDRLGRNVCIYFLLGNCKFGASACLYSHDKAYLPPGRWWEDDAKCHHIRLISTSGDVNPASLPFAFGLLDDRLAWTPAHGVEMEEAFGYNRSVAKLRYRFIAQLAMELPVNKARNEGPSKGGNGRRGRGKPRGGRRGGRLDRYDEFNSEAQERMGNYGFTEEDELELLCQGVKPWDDDAQDVLDALYSL